MRIPPMSPRGKTWRIKTRKRDKFKPKPPKREGRDPWAHSPLIAYLNAHLEWAWVKGYSPRTAQSRRIVIRRFITWCDERGITHPTAVTKQALERYQRHLFYYRKADSRPLTTGTQMAHIVPLKAWFKWLTRENHILYNPASEIDLPRRGRQLPRGILSVAEVESILAEAEGGDPASLRDPAL